MSFKIPKIEELKEFIESVQLEKYRGIFYVGCMAGLRVNEIVHLKLQDLDFKDNLTYFRKSKFFSYYQINKRGYCSGNWSMHKLRHFYASWLNENKVDLLVISK